MGRNTPYAMEIYEPDRINFLLRCVQYLEGRNLLWFKFAKKYGVTYSEWLLTIGFWKSGTGEKREAFIRKYMTEYGKDNGGR